MTTIGHALGKAAETRRLRHTGWRRARLRVRIGAGIAGATLAAVAVAFDQFDDILHLDHGRGQDALHHGKGIVAARIEIRRAAVDIRNAAVGTVAASVSGIA